MNFADFYMEWVDKIGIQSTPSNIKAAFFLDDIDRLGIDALTEFLLEYQDIWSSTVTAVLENRSALIGRLDPIDIAKFRLINDRHVLNLAHADFMEDYHRTIDERTLFLIYNRIPPMRICAALNAARTATFALIAENADKSGSNESPLIYNAVATLFQIETHNTLRGYIYFERKNNAEKNHFLVQTDEDEVFTTGEYTPPINHQLVLNEKSEPGPVEMF